VKVTFNGVNQGTFAPTGRIVAFTGVGNDTVTAAGVTRSVWLYAGSGNDTLTGGSAADVLVGGSGSDLLNGGAGRNMLIAGSGRSVLKSSGTDILIAGTTAYDSPTAANQAALNSVLGAWGVHSKASLSLLKNNPGGAALDATSVIGGNTGDTLEGNTSSWFFGDFTYEGGTDTFSDGRRAKKGHQLVPTATELVTRLNG
jgi:Ca2+-binding RTX toxin-like protein